MNPENAAEFYAKDSSLVFYDLAPLKYTGWKDYSDGTKKTFFDNMLSSRLEMHDDFKATRRGNVAWATVTFHLSARLKNAKKIETEGRYTAILEKDGDRWLIVHEHWSAPLL